MHNCHSRYTNFQHPTKIFSSEKLNISTPHVIFSVNNQVHDSSQITLHQPLYEMPSSVSIGIIGGA